MAGDCQICLDGIADDPAAVPCGHLYHRTCIQHWLKKSRTCPACRAEARNAIPLRWSFAPSAARDSSSDGQAASAAELRELQRKNQELKRRIQALMTELEAAEKQQQRMEDLRRQLDASRQREAKAARDLVLERKKAKLAEMESEQTIKALQDRIQELEESTRHERTADAAAAYARRFLFFQDATTGAEEHSASITFANMVREKNCDPYQIIQVQHDMIAKLNAKVRASSVLHPRPTNRIQDKDAGGGGGEGEGEGDGSHARWKLHSASTVAQAQQSQMENTKPRPAGQKKADDVPEISAVASGALSRIASFAAKRSFARGLTATSPGLAGVNHKRAKQL